MSEISKAEKSVGSDQTLRLLPGCVLDCKWMLKWMSLAESQLGQSMQNIVSSHLLGSSCTEEKFQL